MAVYQSEEQQKSLITMKINIKVVRFFREKEKMCRSYILLSCIGMTCRISDGNWMVLSMYTALKKIISEPAGPAEGEYVVPKRRYSAFCNRSRTLLRGKGIEHLFICGGMTDICVHLQR